MQEGKANKINCTVRIGKVELRNPLLRSSLGGRTCNYDGTVTDVWKNFERRFADGGLGGIISTTFHVNEDRVAPLQYPSIARDRYVDYLRKYIPQIQATGCRYFIQIGDPGYVTQTSLFPQPQDHQSSSAGFDFAYGYGSQRTAMSNAEIERAIADFGAAARRVQATGADGLEVTATKGYLIHQFLNPGINRRDDRWGGNAENRFRFLERVMRAVRENVTADFPVGVRLSAADYNQSPWLFLLLRTPWIFGREWMGNTEAQMIAYARRLRDLGVDFLHVVSGFGFPNPRDIPGPFPTDELRLYFNATRHLSSKSAARAAIFNFPVRRLVRWVSNLGWGFRGPINVSAARALKEATGLKVIVNGGFQKQKDIEDALELCDMVSMARALLANPDLPKMLAKDAAPERPCTHCNRCVGRTATSPLGCYEPCRFADDSAIMRQIMEWNRPDPA